jgi:ribosomal protein L1
MSFLVFTAVRAAVSRLPETGSVGWRFIIPKRGTVMVRRSYYEYGKKKFTKKRSIVPLTVHSAMNILKSAKSAIAHGTVDLHGSYDVHIALNLDPLYTPGHALRGVCLLPHGTGGTCRVAAMTNSKELAQQALAAGAMYAGGDVLYKQILVGAVDLRKIDRLIVSEEMAGFCLEHASEMRELLTSTSLRFLLPKKDWKTRVSTPQEFLDSVTNHASCRYVRYRTSILGDVSITLGKVRTHTVEMIEENLKAVLRHLIMIRPDNFGQGRPKNCQPRNRGRYILGIRMSRSFRNRSYPLKIDTLLQDIEPNALHGIGPRIIEPVDPSIADIEETDEYYLNEYMESRHNNKPLSKQTLSMQRNEKSEETPVLNVLYVDDDESDDIEDEKVENHHEYQEEDVLLGNSLPKTALYADEDEDEVEDSDFKECSPLFDDKGDSDGDEFNEPSTRSEKVNELNNEMMLSSDSSLSDEQLTERNDKDGMFMDFSGDHYDKTEEDVASEHRSMGPLNIDKQYARKNGRYISNSRCQSPKGASHALAGNIEGEYTGKYSREDVLKREFALISKESVLRLQNLIHQNKTVKVRASLYSAEPCFGAAAGSLAPGCLIHGVKDEQVPDEQEETIDDVMANDTLAASVPILEISQIMDMMLKSDVIASKQDSIRKGDKIIKKLTALSIKQQQPSIKKERRAPVLATTEVLALYEDSDDDSDEPVNVLA